MIGTENVVILKQRENDRKESFPAFGSVRVRDIFQTEDGDI